MQLADTNCVKLGFGVTPRNQVHHQHGHRTLDSLECVGITYDRLHTCFPDRFTASTPVVDVRDNKLTKRCI